MALVLYTTVGWPYYIRFADYEGQVRMEQEKVRFFCLSGTVLFAIVCATCASVVQW